MRLTYPTLALACCSWFSSQAQLYPPKASPAIAMATADRFTISLAPPRTQLYDWADPLPHHFFDELLSGFFVRTLWLPDSIPEAVALRWIFTGPHGGLTVQITAKQITLIQRYYDSGALWIDGDKKAKYPQKILQRTSAPLNGSPHTITVAVQQLKATITVDGKEVLKQDSLLDLTHHQLAVETPANADDSVRAEMQKPKTTDAHVTIDRSNQYQSILGFGGIMSFPAFHAMTAADQKRWLHTLSENNLLVEREYPAGLYLKKDLSNYATLANAVPHYYGDNFPTGEISDFDYNQHIFMMGGHVLFEFWGLPEWMRNGPANAVNAAEYVRAIVGYCKQSVEKAGKPPETVGIQNEILQNKDTWRAMILGLRKGLVDAGFRDVKFTCPMQRNLI